MTVIAGDGAAVLVLHPHRIVAHHQAGYILARCVCIEGRMVAKVAFHAERLIEASHRGDQIGSGGSASQHLKVLGARPLTGCLLARLGLLPSRRRRLLPCRGWLLARVRYRYDYERD